MGIKTNNCTIKIHFIRTNRIQDNDVNHKGKICKKWRGKNNYFFLSYFWYISLSIHPNFEFGDSLDVEFNSTSNPYPHCILLRYPRHKKNENFHKKHILILKVMESPLGVGFSYTNTNSNLKDSRAKCTGNYIYLLS